MSNTKVGRDADYRIAALNNAVKRGGQDGGVEGKFDVLAEASNYYEWLTGKAGLVNPIYEKTKKAKK